MPLGPDTAIVTLSVCVVVVLADAGVTVKVGVVGCVVDPPPLLLPPLHAPIVKTMAKRKEVRSIFANRFMEVPFALSELKMVERKGST